LTSLDISSNNLVGKKGSGRYKTVCVGVDSDDVYEEERMEPDVSGIIALANVIKDMGAISSVNLLQNDIGTDQAKVLASIMKEHPTLKSLCGNKGDEAELDMSGKNMRAWDAIMLAAEIVDNALMSLNISSNNLSRGELKDEPAYVIQDQRPWGSKDDHYDSDVSGIVAIVNAILGTRALSKLIFGDGQVYHCNNWVPAEPATLELGMTEANFSNKNLGAGGAIIISAWLTHKDNGAMSSLDLSKNRLGGFYEGYCNGGSGYGSFTATPEGPKAIADAIRDMRALTHLDVSGNSLGQLVPPDGWERNGVHYRQHGGDWTTTVPAGSQPLGIIAIANAIPDMGALSLANVMGNRIGKEMLSKLQEIMRSKPNLISLCGIADDATEVDLSGLGMDADDAIILASELPDKRAISSINLLKNRIPVEQAQGLVKIMQSKEKLFTLCGLSKEEAELDFSGQDLHAGDAVLITNDISDMGALSVLSLRDNRLCSREAGKVLSQMLKGNSVLTELDVSSNYKKYSGDNEDGPGFAQELATGIKDNRALMKLDISSNRIGAEQERDLQRICVAGGIELAK
jgi:hypothetical protein